MRLKPFRIAECSPVFRRSNETEWKKHFNLSEPRPKPARSNIQIEITIPDRLALIWDQKEGI